MPFKKAKESQRPSSDTETSADAEHLSKTDTAATENTQAAPWKALFFFTTRPNLPLLIAGIICSTIAGAASPFQSYLTGKLFEGFTDYASGKLDGHALMLQQKKYVLYLVALAGASWLVHSLEFMLWLAFGELQAKSARDRLFHGLLERDIEWYDMRKNGIGALLPRLQAQIRDLQLATSQPLGLLFSALSQFILSLTEAFHYQWKLTFVTLSTSPLIVILFGVCASNMQANIDKQQDKLGDAQKYSTSAFASIETVKCFNGQEVEHRKYMIRIREAAHWWDKVVRASGYQQAIGVFFTSTMFVQGFYYGGVLIRNGEADVAKVMTTFLAAIGGFQALQMILPQMINLEKGRTAGATLRAVMAEVQRGSNVRRNSGLLTLPLCHGDIDVQNLTFAYPSRPDQLALDDVTMFIPGGQLTFLIGKSGSGKSTLSQLLMRFYSSNLGQVLVDGVPLESLDAGWLRSNITLVEQQSLLFNDTVYRNIAFGRKDYSTVTPQEVREAAEFALLQLMITDMPNGLDTAVGYKGGAMSGGQRQRMALARARLRDTPILILDESTSALDHISRALMMDAIRQWRKGKTTIIITHDITQIQPDDYLYLLEHGKLVQEGYRKHLERMKDTPFQSFLPEEERATISPFDVRKTGAWESIRTRGSSLDTLGPVYRQSHLAFDPLEAHLEASEKKRSSFLPAVFEGETPVPVMGAFGRVAPMSAWKRTTLMPPSPTSPTAVKRWSQMLEVEPKTPFSPVSPSGGQRQSAILQKLVSQTGRFAAASRLGAMGENRRRRPVDTVALAGLQEEGEEHLFKDAVKSKAVLHIGPEWSLSRVLGTVWPKSNVQSRLMLIVGFYGCTMHAVSNPMFSFVLSKLLATYSLPGGDRNKQLIYSMAILAIAGGDAFHTWLQRYLLGSVGQRWVDGFRDRALARILDQPKAFFDMDENSVSHLSDSLDRNAEAMRELLSTFAALGYMAIAMVLVSVLWTLGTSWKMTLIALSAAPYVLGVSRMFAAISGKWESRSNDAAEAASAIFTETFTNIKTVRALTLEPHFKEKYTKSTNNALVVGLQRSFYTGFFFGLSDSAAAFSTAMVFYIGSWLISKGTPVMKCVQAVVMLMFCLANVSLILELIPQVGSAQDSASRLMRLGQLPQDSHEHLGDTQLVTVGDVAFNNLRFAYPTRPEHTVLRSINLLINAGASTAIVGGSGSGKSTTANLLLDLWSTAQMPPADAANAGELLVGGRDVHTVSTPSLRALVVPVLQSPTLFAASVAENITYGLSAASPFATMVAIIHAAQQAGIHEFITSLPQGYETPIGDGGMGLSGGQAQRVAIARALVRRPQVLILDEATSALDVESAALVRQTIQNLVEDRSRSMTVIIITHSRDMMEMAENIVVLNHGEIVEQGGFDELLMKGGALSNLLSGGEWTSGKPRAASSRKRGGPKLKDIDWRTKQKARPRRLR